MMSIQGLFMVVMLGIVYGDPTARIILEEANIEIADNPYVDNWTVHLHPGGEKVSGKLPMKQGFPPNMMVKIEASLDGNEMPEMVMTVCEGLEDEVIIKDMIDRGLPKGIFPTECPIPAGDEFEIKDWPLSKPSSKIPPGIPDGKVKGTIKVFELGKSPIITITGAGRLTHEMPGFGR